MRSTNNQKHKQVSWLFLAIVLCVNCTMPITAYANKNRNRHGDAVKQKYNERTSEYEEFAEQAERQYELNILYNEIRDDMLVNENESQSAIYKEDYAGCYIDDDKLVVCVTNSQAVKDEDEEVEYEIVENSYNDLLEIQKRFGALYSEYYEMYKNQTREYELLESIRGFAIDEENNTIVVDVYELDDTKAQIFERLFGKYDCVELNNSDAVNEEQEAYRPGRALFFMQSESGTLTWKKVSMGYRAYRKTSSATEFGFVTCGHGVRFSTTKKVYSSMSTANVVGTVVASQYSGSVDASFIKIANPQKDYVTTRVQYDANGGTSSTDSVATYSYMSGVAKGSRVYKVGATSYKTTALVKSTNYTVTIGSTTFENMTKTEKFSKSGDSGGIVYTYYNSKYIPAGIIQGSGPGLFTSYSFYVKASEIVKNMNVYPY